MFLRATHSVGVCFSCKSTPQSVLSSFLSNPEPIAALGAGVDVGVSGYASAEFLASEEEKEEEEEEAEAEAEAEAEVVVVVLVVDDENEEEDEDDEDNGKEDE